jgi:2-methylisocitrate lyase-like PEP mutase family enzyme
MPPAPKDMIAIITLVSAVPKPVNVVMSHADTRSRRRNLAAAGVKRISVRGSITRYAMTAFLTAGKEMANDGRFKFIKDATRSKTLKVAFAVAAGKR